MPALDFATLLQQERARVRRERAKAAGGDGGGGGESGATTKQQQEPTVGDNSSSTTPKDPDAVLAAALAKLQAGGGGEGGGEASAGTAVDVNVMAVAAARAVEEAKATRRLMQATLPSGMLAGRVRGEGEAGEGPGAVDLEAHALPGPPHGVSYIPDFVLPELEAAILAIARAVPDNHPAWVRVRGRRLQCYGGEPTDAFEPQQLPAWVAQLCEALVGARVFGRGDKPNHVLLNEYRPGEGIMAHTDGPFYHPRAAILSLGGPAVFHFRRPRSREADGASGSSGAGAGAVGSLVLQPRSLLVFTGEAYESHLHEILPVGEEVVGMVDDDDEDEEEEGEEGGETVVTRMKEGAPVMNLAAAGVKVGDVIRRAPVRVSLTFRRVRGKKEEQEAGKKGRGGRE